MRIIKDIGKFSRKSAYAISIELALEAALEIRNELAWEHSIDKQRRQRRRRARALNHRP